MFDERTHRCESRIVSIHQPWVRPIVRGMQHKPTEFGAKINVSIDEAGLSRVDHFSREAFNEGQDLKEQVESYKGKIRLLSGSGIGGSDLWDCEETGRI